jgi:hypothetical protein
MRPAHGFVNVRYQGVGEYPSFDEVNLASEAVSGR